MKLSYFLQIKVVYASKIFFGPLYIPFLNWLLMIETVLAAAIYNNLSFSYNSNAYQILILLKTTSLGNAYRHCSF